MPFDSLAQIVGVSLSTRGDKWQQQLAGKSVIGGAFDRPWWIFGDGRACRVSIKAPVYDSPYGWTGGTSAITVQESGSGNTPAGDIYVHEFFYRESTNELGAQGDRFGPFTLAGGTELTIRSTAPVPSSEQLVTHREFYVSYPDSPGAYYLWQRIPYTVETAGDVTTATSFTFNELVKRKPKPEGETELFPAVQSAAFRFGRLVGAGQAARLPLGCTLTIDNGASIATITGGNAFDESDPYRAIVYTGDSFTDGSGRYIASGTTIAFIKQVLSATEAKLLFPQGLDVTTWLYSDFSATNSQVASEAQFRFDGRGKNDLYYTPNYAGEAYGGLSNGLVSWLALNTGRDTNVFESAGRAIFVRGIGPSLLIGYERGFVLARGNYNVDNPTAIDYIPLSEELGTVNAHGFWSDNDRNIYLQASGRIFAVMGNRLADISKQMRVASFARKVLGGEGSTLSDQRIAWNPEMNSALIVGLTKTGDAEQYTYGLQLCFDQSPPSLHPLRFPAATRTAVCIPRDDDGVQRNQWLVTYRDKFALYDDLEAFSDTYYNAAGTLLSSQEITYHLETGAILFDWKAIVKRMGFVFENDAAGFGLSMIIKAHEKSNLKAVTTTRTQTLTRGTLDNDFPPTYQGACRAVRVRISGSNEGEDTALLRMTLFVEPQKSPSV